MTAVTDGTFDAEVSLSKMPVIARFWASWCQPCKAMAPIIEAIASEFAGKVKFVTMNVDECPVHSQKFSIQRVPTLAVFEKGKITSIKSGPATKSQIMDWIELALPGASAL